jgi:dipeptidyl aminopeptidase/acylaminoacyl peptidase
MYRLAFLFALCSIAAGQPRPIELKDYYQIESVTAPALSPDGLRVAFVRTRIAEAENKRLSSVWLAPSDGATPPVQVSDPTLSATAPRWSPDGKLLSYTAGPAQWFLHMDEPHAETTAPKPFQISGVGGPPVFSPDSQWIAFTKKVSAPKNKTSELSEFDRLTQERFKGRMYDWMNFRFDGRGYLPDPRTTSPSELFLVAAAGGEPKQITHLGVDVLNPAWRRDGKALTFTASTHQRDEYSYERADLWTIAIGGEPKSLTADDGWHHLSPAWSPDGKTIAVLREEGLNRILDSKRKQGSAIDICLIPAEGGALRNLTADWDDIPGPPRWSPDGGSIYFHAGVKGTAHLFKVSTSGGKVTQLTQGDRLLGDFTMAGDRVAYTSTSPNSPVELYSAPLNALTAEKQLTRVQPAYALGKVERIRYDSKDGTSIDGWVILPPGYDPQKRPYPMILNIHGGPHGAYASSFAFEEQLQAATGYIVLYTNPRGSTGYGEKFLWGTWGGWGDRDFEDVMSGVDYALKHYNGDPKRLGVTGYSYGGFLTNWIIGHTTRFAAAVVGAGPSDWISNYGTGDIPRTKESEFLGRPWEPEARAVMLAHSPITYAEAIRTPTLFVHGEADARVPIAQAEEMYTTLKKLRVPAKFVRYPGEYHGGWSPWDTVHRYQQEMLWWSEYLKK